MKQIDDLTSPWDAVGMSVYTSPIGWLFVLAILLGSVARADEKPVASPAADVKATRQQSDAKTTAGPEKEIANSIGMKLVLIRAGNFMMGSPANYKESEPHEKPQHRVQITRQFYLGKYEVTRGEFQKFVTATKYKTDLEKSGEGGWGVSGKNPAIFARKPEFTWRNSGLDQTDEHPVVNVSWNDAVEFCNWLSKQEGQQYRLPTEAEWEWACRAGTIERWNCADKEDDLKGQLNVADASLRAKCREVQWARKWNDSFPFTSPVGKFKPNKFGLYDMHGNASEWCSDWYDEKYYVRSPVNDPQGPPTGTHRAYRGGSWFLTPQRCRSAERVRYEPTSAHFYISFRVARDR